MIPYPSIDPVIVRIGPLAVRWYGMMYLLGFFGAYLVIGRLSRRRSLPLSGDTLADLVFFAVLGVILGGRLGYVLFYNLPFYLQNPSQVFAIWEGGMSFHGGLLGVVVAAWFFCLRKGLPKLLTGDVLVTSAPIGLGLGRLGNFINAELYGRVTDVPWGMVFPGGGAQPRHPSQLYEAILEGPVLFLILWYLHRRQAPAGVPFFAFFLLYGLFRFSVEFFREPDVHLGFLWGGATMGQLLSLPMIVLGVAGIVCCLRRERAR
jgi:phosphatidylglycerol:prolipoprotein diacylglycerol transferase